MSGQTAESEVLKALSQIIDPDFGTDIVSCGFVKDLLVDYNLGEVLKTLHSDLPVCLRNILLIQSIGISGVISVRAYYTSMSNQGHGK